MALLKVNDLTIKFGGLTAVSDFSLEMNEHDIVGLIGPNGAGKTTIFNMLTGVYAPTSGKIEFLNENIEGIKPYEITKKKIARTFQNIRLFKKLTVIENLKISFNYQIKYNLCHSVLRLRNISKKKLKLLKNQGKF